MTDEFGINHVLLRRLSIVSPPPPPTSTLRKKVVTIQEEEEPSDEKEVDIDILVLLPERDSERDIEWLLEQQRT